jgi:putative FmdB family regulatory protein
VPASKEQIVPTYQYSCTDCGHFFEAVQSFSDDSLTVCPECDGKLRKVFNAVGVVFKGSGFYRNDSRGTSTSASPAASGDAPAASTPATKSDSPSTGGGSASPAAASPQPA